MRNTKDDVDHLVDRCREFFIPIVYFSQHHVRLSFHADTATLLWVARPGVGRRAPLKALNITKNSIM
jgi:hypothetical protein